MTKTQKLTEDVPAGQFNAVSNKILKFLRGALGSKVYKYPAPEEVISGGVKLIGCRYFAMVNGKPISLRLNWGSTGVNSNGLISADYWSAEYGETNKTQQTGEKKKASSAVKRLTFEGGQSLVKTLPMIADLTRDEFETENKNVTYIEESVKLDYNALSPVPFDIAQHFLGESIIFTGSLHDTVAAVISAFRSGEGEGDQYRAGGSKKYGPGWNSTVKTIRANYPELIVREGRKSGVNQKVAATLKVEDIIDLMNNTGSTVQATIVTPPAEIISSSMTAEDLENLSYQAQLESLKSGVKLLRAGATQALFITGRGGTGKTQNVEDELAKAGLEDGNGYTVIKGSASTAGLYRAFYQNRNGILFFDDADSALSDQDSRNLFKAACDTKPIRKLSWQKGGANYVDPADFDPDADDGTLPRSFEFKGKVIFISNLSINKLDPDGALRTRAYVIPIDPVDQDMIDFMRQIAPAIKLEVDYVLTKDAREEVVDLIADRVSHVDSKKSKLLNLRMLVRALNTRAGIELQGGTDQEWKNFVTRFI